MSTPQIQRLEKEAYEQRRQLADTASHLREKVEVAREKFSFARNLHDNFFAISAVASAAAFFLGYAITGSFRAR
jgi:hypothetical protein